MKTLISCAVVLALLSSVAVAQRYDNDYRAPPDQNYYQDRQRDQNYNQDPRYSDRNFRGGPKWRPGEVIPGQLLGRVVGDWEERGLMRPPGGHEWVRVGEQFILVRERDRMISRVINFD